MAGLTSSHEPVEVEQRDAVRHGSDDLAVAAARPPRSAPAGPGRQARARPPARAAARCRPASSGTRGFRAVQRSPRRGASSARDDDDRQSRVADPRAEAPGTRVPSHRAGAGRAGSARAARRARAGGRASTGVAVSSRTPGRRASARSISLTFTGLSSTWSTVRPATRRPGAGLGAPAARLESPPAPRSRRAARAPRRRAGLPRRRRLFVVLSASSSRSASAARRVSRSVPAAPRRLCASRAAADAAVARSDGTRLRSSDSGALDPLERGPARRGGRRQQLVQIRLVQAVGRPQLVGGRDRLRAPRDAELVVATRERASSPSRSRCRAARRSRGSSPPS